MNSFWYSRIPPYIGAEFWRMRKFTWGKNRNPSIEMVYWCHSREDADVKLIIECDTKKQRNWLYRRLVKLYKGKPYEKGLKQTIEKLRKEFDD